MTRTRYRARGIIAALATGAMVATLAGMTAGSAVAAPQAASAAQDTAVNGYRNVGYFAQWGVYGRGYKLSQLERSGGA
ncbi:chitinase, partial [Schumannella luteola]